jgi:hypothetical protein
VIHKEIKDKEKQLSSQYFCKKRGKTAKVLKNFGGGNYSLIFAFN